MNDELKDIKESFEEFCDKRFTLDEFMQTLVSSFRVAEPDFWEFFDAKVQMRDMLREKMNAARRRRAEANSVSVEAEEIGQEG